MVLFSSCDLSPAFYSVFKTQNFKTHSARAKETKKCLCAVLCLRISEGFLNITAVLIAVSSLWGVSQALVALCELPAWLPMHQSLSCSSYDRWRRVLHSKIVPTVSPTSPFISVLDNFFFPTEYNCQFKENPS